MPDIECIDSQFFKIVHDQNSYKMLPAINDNFDKYSDAHYWLDIIKQSLPKAYIIKVTNYA